MSEGPEKAFRKKICTELVKYNAKIINNIQYGGQVRRGQFLTPGEPGISDVTMIHKDTGIVFLEFKSSDGKLSPLQKRFLQEVNERVPYSGFVVREGTDQYGLIEDENDKELGAFKMYDGGDFIQEITKIKEG